MSNKIKKVMVVAMMCVVLIESYIIINPYVSYGVVHKPKVTYEKQLKLYVKSKGYKSIDSIDVIDKYKKGKWYAYYIMCDGDCYVVTLKKGKVDVWCQLN